MVVEVVCFLQETNPGHHPGTHHHHPSHRTQQKMAMFVAPEKSKVF